MEVKKTPMRTCCVTREKLPKMELIRVVRTPLNEVIIDLKGKANGRGAYLKKDVEVFKKAKKSQVLNKHLGIDIPDKVYEELEKLI
jgi:uncharacterized protein